VDRRSFIAWASASAASTASAVPSLKNLILGGQKALGATKQQKEVADLVGSAAWQKLDLGDRIWAVGKALEGTAYVASTLEQSPEACRVVWNGLDCVTFLELCWAVASTKSVDLAKLTARITQTRYRNGKVNGYASRLHYTSEWLHENREDRRIKLVCEDWPESIEWTPEVGFMSKNPERYPALKADGSLVAKIRSQEDAVNRMNFKIVPKEAWSQVISRIQEGDFVAFVTRREGLDFSHVGLLGGAKGTLLHASQTREQVVVQDLIEWGQASRTVTGMVVSRSLN
jgi:hypothetical protein